MTTVLLVSTVRSWRGTKACDPV